MAAPIYSQSQVSKMLAMRKCVLFSAWESRWAGRQTPGEIRHRIHASPENESDTTKFSIESCHCLMRREVSFTLFGKMRNNYEHPICRYEVQNCRHKNPKWFPPEFVPYRAIHRHVYNERAIREDLTWDECAEVRGSSVKGTTQMIDRLTRIFLSELNIEVYDPDVVDGLFSRKP